MKPRIKFSTEHNYPSNRHVRNYLFYGNSQLPGTRLSFGNLHSLLETGVRRRPGKTPTREITAPERSCGDDMASLRLPSSPLLLTVEGRVVLYEEHIGLWEHPPQVHLAQDRHQRAQNHNAQETKQQSNKVHASRAPHGKKLTGD